MAASNMEEVSVKAVLNLAADSHLNEWKNETFTISHEAGLKQFSGEFVLGKENRTILLHECNTISRYIWKPTRKPQAG